MRVFAPRLFAASRHHLANRPWTETDIDGELDRYALQYAALEAVGIILELRFAELVNSAVTETRVRRQLAGRPLRGCS